ncbi:hypothetical protein BMF94_7112 [Rhodotorula taiwanensis]|uniref:Uncharacterized protein n=1 Tax=Rhodotorula taiwanensis TaxID=741276 RepID=A0A2S5AZ40_9BASI|nr:hypothetical protein BMF94_7112 [Rhodotorula taiwanensis]
MDYKPRHAQPVTLAQLRQLEPELLTNEIARLENSVQHLEASNVELKQWAGMTTGAETAESHDEVDEETRREFAEAAHENEETIASQRERLSMIRLVLEEKIGVDATNPHYELPSHGPSSGSASEGVAQPGDGLRSTQSAASEHAPLNSQARATSNLSQTPAENGSVEASADDGMYL